MAKLVWDQMGQRLYETGTDHGVVYPNLLENNRGYGGGVAWNGLTAVTESPSGADPTDIWADNIKYLTIRAAEEFGGTIEAYTYPDEFAVLDGSVQPIAGVTLGQQSRRAFGFSFRSIVGNDVSMNDYGYKLHCLYSMSVSPSEKGYQTVNDSPEAINFSWEFTTTPVAVSKLDQNGKAIKATAQLIIDSTKVDPAKLAALEEILYGSDTEEPRLPLPDEIITLLDPGTTPGGGGTGGNG